MLVLFEGKEDAEKFVLKDDFEDFDEFLRAAHIQVIVDDELQRKRVRVPPWMPSTREQKIVTKGTATLFAGKSIPIGWDSFGEIVNGGYTFLDKTLLIAEFIECNSKVSLVIRPRRFGKTFNLTMLRDFFSIPIHPDNEDYRRELFKDTKIMKRSDLFDDYFRKYPVIFLCLKGFDGCKTWSEMLAQLCQKLATLYEEHQYVYENLSKLNASRFDQIYSGFPKDGITKNALLYLSNYLKDYYKKKCIVLIDEYDHTLDVAYHYQYYEEAHSFFSDLFGELLMGNDVYLEKGLLVDVSRVAKSGYLSGVNNLDVFTMHDQVYADKFGFTEDEVSVILQYYSKEDQLKEVKKWYDGMASKGRIHLYNPWSINKFITTNNLGAHLIDTGGTKTIKDLLWSSTKDFKNNTLILLEGDAIEIGILDDIDYDVLAQKTNVDQVLWTLLYYTGYLSKDKNEALYIPNMEVSMEWQEWLTNSNPLVLDSMLKLLLQGEFDKFKESFPRFIMNALSYVSDNLVESNYHLFVLCMFHQALYRG